MSFFFPRIAPPIGAAPGPGQARARHRREPATIPPRAQIIEFLSLLVGQPAYCPIELQSSGGRHVDQPNIIEKGADGYYHPKDEEEVIALVKHAARHRLQIRARGASHSTALSIFTDPVDGKPRNRTLNRTPPTGPNLNLAMDRMNRLEWIHEANGIGEPEAGIHLGRDPYDAIGPATLDNSLLHQLFEKGWGINDLGGITHQTVSGFTATGSAGGSLKHPLDNVAAVRLVDAT